MYSTGTSLNQGQFSRDLVGSVVGEYIYLAQQLSDHRWDVITELCGNNKEPAPLVRHSAVNRRALYESSSPAKESDGA
jgi:hypothetical protein